MLCLCSASPFCIKPMNMEWGNCCSTSEPAAEEVTEPSRYLYNRESWHGRTRLRHFEGVILPYMWPATGEFKNLWRNSLLLICRRRSTYQLTYRNQLLNMWRWWGLGAPYPLSRRWSQLPYHRDGKGWQVIRNVGKTVSRAQLYLRQV